MRRSLIFSKEKSPLPRCSISFFCDEGIHPARGRRGGRLEDGVRTRRGLVLVRPFAPLRGGSRQSRSAVGVGHTRVSRAGSDGVASSDTSLGGWVGDVEAEDALLFLVEIFKQNVPLQKGFVRALPFPKGR